MEQEQLEDGDVFSSGSGENIGNVDTAKFTETRNALHLQIYVDGEWYIYQLTGIEELEKETDGAPTQG